MNGTAQADPSVAPTNDDAIATTRAWIDRAVIGLNLCPFARAPYVQGRLRIAVSRARDPGDLAADLHAELVRLRDADTEAHETSLLVHPFVLGDFADFNDFLDVAEAQVAALGLAGEIQIASFHPRYRFAGTGEDEAGNRTNRSPWPTLHLLREASIDRAIAAMPDTDMIYRRNIETLRELGTEGWRRLWLDLISPPAAPAARDPGED